MFPRFWTVALHVLGVISLNLEPMPGINLPANNTFFNLTSPNPDPIDNSSLPIVVDSIPSQVSNQSSGKLGDGFYQCDQSKFGRPAIDSCREAYSWIVAGKEILTYGDRSTPGTVDVRLPLRYSSSM